MIKTMLNSVISLLLIFAGSNAFSFTAIRECPRGFESALVRISASVFTNKSGCPLLEKKKLRRLVNKNFPGTVFAYPTIPFSCLSGTVNGKGESIVFMNGNAISVTGTTQSAQRVQLPDALEINPVNGGFILQGQSSDGISFFTGAAVTIVTLKGENAPFKLQLVLSDRFGVSLIEGQPAIDKEDFEVVAANGTAAKGRLTGTAEITGSPFPPLSNVDFNVKGLVCVK